MLRIFGGSLAARLLIAYLPISLLVLKVKLWKFAFEHSHPTVYHNLTVIERINFQRLFESPGPTVNLSTRTGHEQRLSRLLGLRPWLARDVIWIELGRCFGRVCSPRLLIPQSLATFHQIRIVAVVREKLRFLLSGRDKWTTDIATGRRHHFLTLVSHRVDGAHAEALRRRVVHVALVE